MYVQGDRDICADEEKEKMRDVELQGELDSGDIRCDREEIEVSDEEIVQCDKVQCEIVEKAKNENLRGDPECNVQCDPVNVGESEFNKSECQENKVKTNEKNVRWSNNVGEENGQEVQCDHKENVQCDQTECVIQGECQDESLVIYEKDVQCDQNGGVGEECQQVRCDRLETAKCDTMVVVNENKN